MADDVRSEVEGGAPIGDRVKWSSLLLILTFVGGASLFVVLLLTTGVRLDGLSSAILIVAGFVSVALLMLAASIVMTALGMATPTEALGMPTGSIRALIAMVLILMFAIIGIVVFNAGTSSEQYQSAGLTQAQVDQARAGGMIVLQQVLQSAAPVASGEPVPEPLYTVMLRPAMTTESHDFGLQLLTTVSTLVVAVAGFYFGSRATDRAIAAAKDFRPPERPAPGVVGTVPATAPDDAGDGEEDDDEEPDSDEPLDDAFDEEVLADEADAAEADAAEAEAAQAVAADDGEGPDGEEGGHDEADEADPEGGRDTGGQGGGI